MIDKLDYFYFQTISLLFVESQLAFFGGVNQTLQLCEHQLAYYSMLVDYFSKVDWQ